MRSIHPEFFILSASCSAFRDDDNRIRTREMEDILHLANYPYKKVQGVYKGVPEDSFLVVTEDTGGILELANSFNQEAVLHVSPMREASLVFLGDTPPVYQGLWTEVTKHTAQYHDNYTIDMDERYYICRKIS